MTIGLERELRPHVERCLERHLGTAREWFPHELVPWGRGRDFEPGEAWAPSAACPDATARSALLVNVLTEDNLPHYFRVLGSLDSADGAWGTWTRRWTAEEGRHAIVIRDYLVVTRSVDLVALERARMHQVCAGVVPEAVSVPDTLVYVTIQELATRIAHTNTGRLLDDAVGGKIMARVAGDEHLHHVFYRDLTTAAMGIDPSAVVIAMDRQVRNFTMPGVGIPDFARHARAIARSGVYDFAVHHDQILAPLIIELWAVPALGGLSAEAERARDSLLHHIARLGAAARRLIERRHEVPAVTA